MRQAVESRPLEMSAAREEGWYGGSAPPDAAAEEARLGKEADDAFANERDWVLLLSSWC